MVLLFVEGTQYCAPLIYKVRGRANWPALPLMELFVHMAFLGFVAGEGFEPPTSGLWARCAGLCTNPRHKDREFILFCNKFYFIFLEFPKFCVSCGMVKESNTDTNLLALFKAGEDFINMLDPEGILANFLVTKIVFGRKSENGSFWKVWVSFFSGEKLCISGRLFEGRVSIHDLSFSFNDNQEKVPVLVEKTLVLALGNLSGIPARLKKVLSSQPKRRAFMGNPVGEVARFFLLTESALFFGVRGGGLESGNRTLFPDFCVCFNYSGDEVTSLSILSKYMLDGGKRGFIKVSMGVDIFGLNSKKVYLDRNLGLGHHAGIDCTEVFKGRNYPSLDVALSLDRIIPVYYTKERKSIITRGKPKAAPAGK